MEKEFKNIIEAYNIIHEKLIIIMTFITERNLQGEFSEWCNEKKFDFKYGE